MNRKRIVSALIMFVFVLSFITFKPIPIVQGNQQQIIPSLVNANVSPDSSGFNLGYTRMLGILGRPYIKDFSHLNEPYGLAVSGNTIWIAELMGQRALHFSINGTYLGPEIGDAGTNSFQGKSLSWVSDVAIDSAGNVWMASTDAGYILEFDPSGNFIKQIGEWQYGTDNQHFGYPSGIAFDSKGNIYVADGGLTWPSGNHRIQIFNSSGVYLHTIGETGVSGSDNNHFFSPIHIAIDSQDYLYIADRDNQRVQIFNVTDPNAPVYFATLGVPGECGYDATHLCNPSGVAVDANYIYVASTGGGSVRIYNKSTRNLVNSITELLDPSDVAVDSNGNLFIAEWHKQRVLMYNSSLVQVRTFGETGVPYLTDGLHFNEPSKLAAAPDGGLLVLESKAHRLVKLNAQGAPQWTLGEAGVPGGDNAHLSWPFGIAVDSAGKVYVGDNNNDRILILNSNGSLYAKLGEDGVEGSDSYHFIHPQSVSIGPDGRIYVADRDNHRIQVYDSNRVYVATMGVTGVAGSDNSHFSGPQDIVIDSTGKIYVADSDNQRIQVFNSAYVYQYTIGGASSLGGHFGQIRGNTHLAVDGQNRLYVIDPDNGQVQIFDAAGTFLTVISTSGGMGIGQVDWQEGGTVDKAGNFYLADGDGSRINVYAPGVPSGWRLAAQNGFGNPGNIGIFSLAVLDGKLYASTANWWTGESGNIWRSTDGHTWEEVAAPGVVATVGARAISKLYVFGGKLYAATLWGDSNDARLMRYNGSGWDAVFTPGVMAITSMTEFNGMLYVGGSGTSYADGNQIWRSPSGDAGTWTNVLTGGNGNPHNDNVYDLAVFNGKLYAVSSNPNDGFEVWQSSTGTAWTPVITGGKGDPASNDPGGFGVYNSQLYIGVNNPNGGRLWRSSDGVSWNPITLDGFGNSKNSKIEAVFSYGGSALALVSNNSNGSEIWRSSDGANFLPLMKGGFGDAYTNGFSWSNAQIEFNGTLYLGTWNNAGGELWAMDFKSIFLPFLRR